jgi:hypothetical protein
MKKLALLSILFSFSSAFAVDKGALESNVSEYGKIGKEILEMVVSKNVEPTAVAAKVAVMMTKATAIASAYSEAYPEGKELLDTVVQNAPEMKKLSFHQLEKEWHDLEYFAKPGNGLSLDLKNEDNEHFTDAVHMIVHLYLTLSAAEAYSASKADADLQTMKEEMTEGMEQVVKAKDKILAKVG